VRIWDVASGELMQTLEVPYSAVFTEVAWDGTANQIIAATDLGEILLWDAEADETSGTLPAQGNITELAFAPQTPVLGVATTEGGIAYWNIVNQENIQTMPADSGIVHFAWSPDGTQLARITVEGAIELLDAVSNERLQQMSAANRPVVLDYAPSGTVIAVGDMTGTINLLDAASLDTLTTWNVAAAVVELAYQPNGNLLAVLSAEGLYLWDGTEIVASLGGIFRNGAAVQAVFAPEAAHIAVSYASTSANLVQYDLESGAVLTSGEVFGQAIPPYVRLHYSPDGTLIAVNDTFGIALLNSETGEQNTYLDTVGTVISFAFTPDGSLIVTGDNGGVLQVWDTASGQVLATFQDHTAAIQHVAFNAAGALLLSASADGTVRVYGIGQ
jgi:WD40 repeat protein